MNLWSYGYMKHLLACKTGTLPQLSHEEEVARMRHFLDMMETTALHSSMSDFQCEGWEIAREFDSRVMADIDQGEVTWPTVATSSLVVRSYNQAVHCIQQRLEKGTGGGDGRRICPTYNTFTATEGASCEYEAAHPGTVCRFQHICSFCATRGNSHPHKVLVCRAKAGRRSRHPSTTSAGGAMQQS